MNQKQRTIKSNSVTSPYMELLQSKKKIYGLKYHTTGGSVNQSVVQSQNHNASFSNSSANKSRPASSSIYSQNNKPTYKSNSSQKVKGPKSQHTKKKRVYTEQADQNDFNQDPKLHESLYINMDKNQASHLATKSLFYNQVPHNKEDYISNFDFLKKFTQFNTKKAQKINGSGTKSNKSHKQKKSKSKSKKTHKYMSSMDKYANPFKSLQNLNLTQIDQLIALIDNCVQEANQYIAYLSSKVQNLKNQLIKCKAQEFQLQNIIKVKNQTISTQECQIISLRKQVQKLRHSQKKDQGKDIKKLLEVINDMSEQNMNLQQKIKNLQIQLDKKYDAHPYRKDSKETYNQIHSKIDILNISIDSNKKMGPNNNSSSSNEQKNYDKKYKFIKPKYK